VRLSTHFQVELCFKCSYVDRNVPIDNVTFCSTERRSADKQCSASEPSIPADDGCRNSFRCYVGGRVEDPAVMWK